MLIYTAAHNHKANKSEMATERMRTTQNNIFIQHELKHFCSNDTRTDSDTSDSNITVKTGRQFFNMGWVSKA